LNVPDAVSPGRILLGLLTLLAFGYLPGYTLARWLLTSHGRAIAVSVAPALSAGLLYGAGQLSTAVGLPVDWRLAAGVALVPLLTITRPRSSQPKPVLRSRSLLVVLCAAGLGTLIWMVGIGALDRVPPHDDGYNHGLFIQRIVETRSLDPAVLASPEVVGAGHGLGFYPLALHQQAAVLVASLHVDVGVAWTITSLSSTVLAFPAGMLVLVRHLLPGQERVAQAAALLAVLTPGLTYSTAWWGGYTLAAGFAVTPGVLCVVLLAAAGGQGRHVVAAALGLAGLVGIHTSEWSFVLVAAGVLLLLSRPQQKRLLNLASSARRLVGVALLSLAMVAPAVLQLKDGFDERRQAVPADGLPLGQAISELATQFYLTPRSLPLIALACWGGLAVAVIRRHAVAWVALWAVFAACFIWLVTTPGRLVYFLTATWYSDSTRIAYILLFITIPFVSLAVAAGHAHGRREVRAVGTVLGVLLLITVPPASAASVRRDYDHFSLIGKDQRAAFRYMAVRMRPGERVLNQHQDGSPWMYSLYGVRPVFPAKTSGFDDPSWRDEIYLARHVSAAGHDARVDALLDSYSIRFVYVGDKYFSNEEPDMTLAQVRGTCGFHEVLSRGTAHVFERGGHSQTNSTAGRCR
jgi:hypothetical protein